MISKNAVESVARKAWQAWKGEEQPSDKTFRVATGEIVLVEFLSVDMLVMVSHEAQVEFVPVGKNW